MNPSVVKSSQAIILLVLVAFTGCDRSSVRPELPEPSIRFALEPVETYGSPALDSVSKGELGRINAVAVAPDSTLFVLDSDFKRISVFNASGEFRGTIQGGFGEGPGEFSLPIFLDLSDEGDLLVYDYRLGRVSRFETTGAFLSSFIVTERAKEFRGIGSDVWFTHLPARDSLLWISDYSGKTKRHLIPVTEADLNYLPNGIAPMLARSFGGSKVLVAATRPGIWYEVSPETGAIVSRGQAMYPDFHYIIENSVAYNPGEILGIGQLSDGRIVTPRSAFDLSISPVELLGMYLDVFEPEGAYLGSAKIPADWLYAFTVAPDGKSLFLGLAEPYPHVGQYRLVESNAESE